MTIAMEIPRADAITTVTQRQACASIGRFALIAACLVAGLLPRLCYLVHPFDDDSALFIYLGRVVTEGGRFGPDIIDNKFPTVGLMTSLAYRAFGNAWPGYVLLQAAMSISGVMLLARTAKRHLGHVSTMPAMLFAMVYFNFSLAVGGGFRLETIQCFFAICAANVGMNALARDEHDGGGDARDAFVVGLAAGCAAMLKPTGGAVLVAFAIAAIVTWRRAPRKLLRHAAVTLAGLAIPLAVAITYLIATDTLAEMPALSRQIARYAADTPFECIDLLKPAMALLILAFPILLRGVIARRDRIAAGQAPRAMMIFLVAWLALEFLGIVAQRRMYPYHFLPLAPPAALVFAAIPRRERLSHLAAALLPAAIASSIFAVALIAAAPGQPHRSAASQYLLAHAGPGDRIWQDWMARTVLETNLKPGARVPTTFLFINDDAAPQEFSQLILDDFQRLRPRYILLPTDLEARLRDVTTRSPELAASPVRAENYRRAYRAIEAYVKLTYSPEAVVARQTVYRRNP